MDVITTSFGGVLVKTGGGDFAVNAGGTLEELNREYIPEKVCPRALILTTEHVHRFRNAESFALEHKIPLIGSFIAFACRKVQIPERWDVFLPRTITLGTVSIHMFPIKYDSIDAFALTIACGHESVGIVPDGKLSEKWTSAVQTLSSCTQIYFGNIRSSFPEYSVKLRKRYEENYNTQAEIDRLFREYGRKKICQGFTVSNMMAKSRED